MRTGALVGTLLASSRHPRYSRPIEMFGRRPTVAAEEFKALAGVWRADLKLDEQQTSLSLHLATPRGNTDFPHSGAVHFVDYHLPSAHEDADGWFCAWWSANRPYHAGTPGDGTLCLSLQLGNLFLEGVGSRQGDFRCDSFIGRVMCKFEGSDDLCQVGRFSMQLSLPSKADTTLLEKRYLNRIKSNPSPAFRSARPISEEAAKRAWLARQTAPSWGQRPPAYERMRERLGQALGS